MKLKLKAKTQGLHNLLSGNLKQFYSWLLLGLSIVVIAYYCSFHEKLSKITELNTQIAVMRQQMASRQKVEVKSQQEISLKLGQSSSHAIKQLYLLLNAVGIHLEEIKRISIKESSLPVVLLRLVFFVNDRQWLALITDILDSPSYLISDFIVNKTNQVEMELFVFLDKLQQKANTRNMHIQRQPFFCHNNWNDTLNLTDYQQWIGNQLHDIKITTYS